MAKKRKNNDSTFNGKVPAALPTYQPITETIETNYMPYVMSVIVSRAIPEIDGFKPAHRKLLYTMYKMGLLTGPRTKSANVVGQTMRLSPHGDAAIYETLVRLTRGNEALLHPFIDSKGSFGKQYSRNMAYAASRYTEVKLDPFCSEIFSGIDKNAVDFVPNYDNTTVEPTLLPTTFPNILLSPNIGIAVGMACSICSFNLGELCDATIALLKNPKTSPEKILDILKAPDFSTGASIIYDREQMAEIYRTGRGCFKMRARYTYDKRANCIDIIQIPYSTTIELIMKKITELVKDGKLKEIVDFRDEIDLHGFKLTIDLRRGTDPDLLMAKLYKLTPLEDSFDCNFNILVNGVPRLMGVVEILEEWINFRIGCYRRELNFELNKKQEKLHLLLGLGKILLDIDKAIRIVRSTELESKVVPNLMEAFSIDEVQAEYIAEIKLRHLNREYIINRIREIEDLQKEIAELEDLISDELKLKAKIAQQLAVVKKKYAKPRKTQLICASEIEEPDEEVFVENYNVRVLLTKEGYFKKITLQSLRGNDEQKLKEGDEIIDSEECDNKSEFFFITDKARLYRVKVADFEPVKASALGDFLPAKLSMENDERPIMMKVIADNILDHHIIYLFENGKGLRVPMSAYQTKSNRRKLSGVYSTVSPIVAAIYESEPVDIMLINSASRAIVISSDLIPVKTTRTAVGVSLINLRGKHTLVTAYKDFADKYENAASYRKRKIPATGVLLPDSR
ncbi:MAG: topoisomerase IV [Clostridiales bacterium]|nr:topoisomerase IV [Clostridiales bacterium]